MAFLLALLAVLIGLWASSSWLAFIPLGLALIGFTLYRFGWKMSLVPLIVIPLGIGLSYINIETDRSSYTGVVIESHENYYLFQSRLERLYVYEKDSPYEAGDILTINGSRAALSFERLEGSFDFASYLEHKGVSARLYVKSSEAHFLTPIRLRERKESFLSGFGDSSTRELVGAVLFGEDGSGEAVKGLEGMHLVRLVSASGIYLSLFLRLINYLLSKKMKEETARIVSFALLAPYLLFVFPKASALRLAMMFLVWLLDHYVLKRKLGFLARHSLAMILILLFDYHLGYGIGFILVSLVPVFSFFCLRSFPKVGKRKKKIMVGGFVSLSFLPFEAMFFSSIAPLSPLLQFVMLPFMGTIAVIGLLCFYGLPLGFIANGMGKAITWLVEALVPFSVSLPVPSFPSILLLAFYLLLVIWIYLLSIGYRPLKSYPAILLGTLSILYVLPVHNAITSEVSFINVGQGDSILIRSGLHSALVDTGGSIYRDIAGECLVPFLNHNRITSLDYVMITHDDYDHCGALESLRSSFDVKSVIRGHSSFPIEVGDIKINSLNIYEAEAKEENDRSLVLSFEMGDLSFLLMGDASINIEKKLLASGIDLDHDILKAGHHGSETSSSYGFLEAVSPEETIVSVGKNTYGHPSEKVMVRLRQAGSMIRRTDQEGTITYECPY